MFLQSLNIFVKDLGLIFEIRKCKQEIRSKVIRYPDVCAKSNHYFTNYIIETKL
jgi:hypothetical protein